MRVSGGKFKRRELKTPKGSKTRPTSGITRESIFNIISDHIYNAFVLDLFAGSGSLGIEALSRGAASCIFVENDKIPLNCIKENISRLDLNSCSKIVKKKLPEEIPSIFMDQKPDLIFMDPPYSMGFINSTLEMLKKYSFVSSDTIIIAEHSKKESPDVSGFQIKDTRKYGKSLVSFLHYVV